MAAYYIRDNRRSRRIVSYTQVRFLLHSYRALLRWWLSF